MALNDEASYYVLILIEARQILRQKLAILVIIV